MMAHKVSIEDDLEKELGSMEKLLEKDDYTQLKDSMDDKTSTLESQKRGWGCMWKGVGDSLEKGLERM
jgi:hypothetical protein